jgi:hypothetical protein
MQVIIVASRSQSDIFMFPNIMIALRDPVFVAFANRSLGAWSSMSTPQWARHKALHLQAGRSVDVYSPNARRGARRRYGQGSERSWTKLPRKEQMKPVIAMCGAAASEVQIRLV